MNAYDVLIDPTVVTDCVACNFVSSTVKHLVVAKATLLEVYEVLKIPAPKKSLNYKLKLVASFKLQGRVTDLRTIRTAEQPDLDYLLVSTKSAKVSCVRWDVYKHSIVTVSLHYYEHALQNLSYETILESRLVAVSGSSPMLCVRWNNLLVFLPFTRLGDDDDEDVDMEDMPENPKNGTSEPVALNLDNTDDALGALDLADTSLFGSSTIIDAAALDPTIGDIVDFQFLYNYREPTVAILSQHKETWAGLLPNCKDNVSFSVWSLDVANLSATTILKIDNLPYDISRIIPLPSPLNGSLLVGCNELIHVDSGGITRRMALNLYVQDITSLIKGYMDLLQRELKLEDCSVLPLPNDNKVLLVLKNGQMHILTFDVDGKTIKKMTLEEVDSQVQKELDIENPGPIVTLEDNLIFFAGKTCDSILAEILYVSEDTPDLQGEDLQAAPVEEDEDDLYDEEETVTKKINRSGKFQIKKHDNLINIGPLSSFALGKYSHEKYIANLTNPSFNDVSIFAAGGMGRASHLNIISPTVQPAIRSSLRFSQINRLWIIANQYLITSDDTNLKSEIFSINNSYARLPAKHFINDALTIAMHELEDGKFILQVTPKQIILFNNRFKKIMSLENELKEFGEAYIVNSVFNDDLLMTFFSTGEVVVYSINTYSKSFTKVELPKLLSDTIITTGYITNSRILNVILKDINVLVNRGQKRKRGEDREIHSQQSGHTESPKLKTFVLVTGDNRIVVFSRFHNEKCFQLNSIDKFTDYLLLGFFDINSNDPDPFIKQVILNDLGDDASKDEYLTILTIGGEIHSYKMFFDGENYSFLKQHDLAITGAPFNAYQHGTSIERRMIYFPNVSGQTCILVTGVIPYLIMRSAHSQVKIFKFSKMPIVSFVPYSDEKIKNGLIYLDTKKNARIVELPETFNYDSNWPIRRVHVGHTIKAVAFHEGSNTVILSTFDEVPYNCLDEAGDPIVGLKTDKPPATSFKGKISLISPLTWTPIDSIELEENEVALNAKSVALDVGSANKRFKNKKEFILIGTGKFRMEDLGANGSYKLLDIIDIVPEPGKPETNHKFKIFTQEDTKGAVTSACDVTGRFLVAQGQKIIVRDIKDNSAVPVAFMDLSVYVSEAKSFGNLVIFGDSLKSVTLAGFDAEPFRMIALSKDTNSFDISSADFVYRDEEAFIVAADFDQSLHVLQYNPEDPESSNGQKLLLRSSFKTNLSTTSMKCIPKNEQLNNLFDPSLMPFQTIASTSEGAIYTVFPVEEGTYRRMHILSQQLIDKEYHFCGLNPKVNRMVNTDKNSSDLSRRQVLDCEILRNFTKLNTDRQKTLALKISVRNVAVDIWKDFIEMENVTSNL